MTYQHGSVLDSIVVYSTIIYFIFLLLLNAHQVCANYDLKLKCKVYRSFRVHCSDKFLFISVDLTFYRLFSNVLSTSLQLKLFIKFKIYLNKIFELISKSLKPVTIVYSKFKLFSLS